MFDKNSEINKIKYYLYKDTNEYKERINNYEKVVLTMKDVVNGIDEISNNDKELLLISLEKIINELSSLEDEEV